MFFFLCFLCVSVFYFFQQKTEMLRRDSKSGPTNLASGSLKVSFFLSMAGGQVASLEGRFLVIRVGVRSHREACGGSPRLQ